MKVAILTWCYEIGPVNYGQILQCLALQESIKKLGHETYVLKYRSLTDGENIDTITKGKSRIEYELTYKNINVEKQNKPEVKKFLDFIRENVLLSSFCYTKEELVKEIIDTDVVILGSDQMWNPLWFDAMYCLPFATGKKRMTYATGGVDARGNKNDEVYKKIAYAIENFDRVSVRERKSAEILSEYTSKPISTVIDPTLLLKPEEWNRYCVDLSVDEEYIFCYCLGSMQPHKNILKEVARKYGVSKILYIKKEWHKCEYFGEEKFMGIVDAGPGEFISYIKKAKCIVTDSFHGCCISLLYHKDFYSLRRAYETSDIASTSRMDNLFERLKMERRWLFYKGDINCIGKIEYDTVEKEMETFRTESLNFLVGGLN